jgi:AcrR family transcriptional regulator
MAPKRLSREEKKAATREALLKAGAKVVARKGFSASLEEFAEAAGLSKGAIYSNFSSRDDFLLELGARVAPGFQIMPDASLPSLREAVIAAAELGARMTDRDPQQVILGTDFFLLAMRTPSMRRRVRRERAEWEHRSEDMVAAFFRHYGAAPPLDPLLLSRALEACSVGLSLYRIFYGPEAIPDEVFRYVHLRLHSECSECSEDST